MFTLCECFEGKHKAATQWVDYKLGLSFKQTEFINTEFPHTPLAGLSLCAYICGSNTHTQRHTHHGSPCILKSFCRCLSLHCVCTYLCTFFSLFSHFLPFSVSWLSIFNCRRRVDRHLQWWEKCKWTHSLMGKQMLVLQVWRRYYRQQHHFLWDDVMCANQRGVQGTIPQTFCLI